MMILRILIIVFCFLSNSIDARKFLPKNKTKEIVETTSAVSLPQDKETQQEKADTVSKKISSSAKVSPVVTKPTPTSSKDLSSKKTSVTKSTNKEKKDSQKDASKKKDSEEAPLVSCNKIAIRINSKGEGKKDIIITDRMLATKSLDERDRTPEEIILEHCIFDKAVNDYHMPPAIQEAEQHIEGLKNQNGLSQAALEDIFKRAGRTYQEVLDQLIMFYTNNAFISHLITSKVLVTQKEIEEYHKKHPEVVPTSYKIEKSYIQKGTLANEKEAINNLRKYGLGQDNIIWEPAYWIVEDDLADAKKFITKMHEGVVKVIDSDDKWEIIRLVKKVKSYVKPLEERYKEIIGKLQNAQFEEKLTQFKKELLQEYTIIRL